eukprot:6021025-Lingulodinium_polyedra.AAC.1
MKDAPEPANNCAQWNALPTSTSATQNSAPLSSSMRDNATAMGTGVFTRFVSRITFESLVRAGRQTREISVFKLA